MDLSVPDTVDNRYKVLEVIGTGAMATVYAAEDTRLGRKVALKILRPEQAQDVRSAHALSVRRRLWASLNNPGRLLLSMTPVRITLRRWWGVCFFGRGHRLFLIS